MYNINDDTRNPTLTLHRLIVFHHVRTVRPILSPKNIEYAPQATPAAMVPRLFLIFALCAVTAALSSQASATSKQCKCNGMLQDPIEIADLPNVALQFMAFAFKYLTPGGTGELFFGVTVAAMFDARALLVGDHRRLLTVPSSTADLSGDTLVGYVGYSALFSFLGQNNPSQIPALVADVSALGFANDTLRDKVGFPFVGAMLAFLAPSGSPRVDISSVLRNPPSGVPGVVNCSLVRDIAAWQPLCAGVGCTPAFGMLATFSYLTTFQSGKTENVTALLHDFPPPPQLQDRSDPLNPASAFGRDFRTPRRAARFLDDRRKALAEAFAPSIVFTTLRVAFAELAARRVGARKALFVMTGVLVAVYDVGIATNTLKLEHSTARPASVLHCALRGSTVSAWNAPYLGVRNFDVRDEPGHRWTPYLGAQGSPGYVSGHAAIARAATRAFFKLAGRETHGPNCMAVRAGKSVVEPRVREGEAGFVRGTTDVANGGRRSVGYSPKKDTFFCWRSRGRFARLVARSRVVGLVHTEVDVVRGRELGFLVGSGAAKFMVKGRL